MAGGEAELRLDVGDGRPVADPELPVPGVGVELLGVPRGRRAEVQDGLVPALGAGLQHQDAVGLGVRAEPGQVGEGGVRPEGVVGVVAPHPQAAAGDDEPLAGEPLGQGRPSAGRMIGNLGAGHGRTVVGRPSGGHELAELVAHGSVAVAGLGLILTGHAGYPVRSTDGANAC